MGSVGREVENRLQRIQLSAVLVGRPEVKVGARICRRSPLQSQRLGGRLHTAVH